MHMPSAFPILFGIIHVPFDSFISQNEGNAEVQGRFGGTVYEVSPLPAVACNRADKGDHGTGQ